MIGDIAEDFILKDQYGKEFVLYENLQTNLLLVFYPKDDTNVCSRQLTDYNDNTDKFTANNIKVVGINTGSVNSHSTFCNKFNLDITLLSDRNKLVSKMFNALNLFGTNKRKLVLIDTNKKIVFEKTTFSLFYVNTNSILKALSE
ncbi:peroxiredoxin [Bacteroidota bacterium]